MSDWKPLPVLVQVIAVWPQVVDDRARPRGVVATTPHGPGQGWTSTEPPVAHPQQSECNSRGTGTRGTCGTSASHMRELNLGAEASVPYRTQHCCNARSLLPTGVAGPAEVL